MVMRITVDARFRARIARLRGRNKAARTIVDWSTRVKRDVFATFRLFAPRLALVCAGLTLSPVAHAAGAGQPTARTKVGPKQVLAQRLKKNLKPQARPAAPKETPTASRGLPDPYPDPCLGLEALTRRPGQVPFGVGEELAYELTVSGATVGKMELKVGKPRKVEGQLRLPLFGRARTTAFLATFKSFEGRYMTMVNPDNLEPLGVRVESTYGDEERWERVRFERDHHFVGADVLLQGKEVRREYDGEHRLTDLLTLLYVARTMTLQPGMQACQDVFASRRLWRMTATVDGTASVDTPGGDKEAWVVRTKFDRKPTHGLNNNTRPNMEVDIYLAKDDSQTPLQFVVRSQGVEAKGKLVRWSLKGTTPEKSWTL